MTIPSAVTAAEVAELQGLAGGKRVLELGSLLGYSTIRLAEVAEHVVSVDPHQGYPAHAPRPTLIPFFRNIIRADVRDRVTVMVGTDTEILPLLATAQFDLAFIDLTGLYDDTLRAIRLTIPLLRHYAALAVHDCGHPDWPGALDAVEDFARDARTTYRLVDRLAIFEQTWGWRP